MSYQSDKQKMELSHARQKELTYWALRITVMVLAAVFLALGACVAIFELGGKEPDPSSPSVGMPSITATNDVKDGTVYVALGDTISYKKYVSFSGGELEVGKDRVNASQEGIYPVTYTVRASNGKTQSLTLNFVVKKAVYTESALHASLMDKVIPKLGISDGMTTEQKVRRIYAYVNSSANVSFVNESNIPGIQRANWKTDWIEEACRTVETEEGDCYSYYSLSKALFEYYGIANYGIRRDDSRSNESGTHFWQMVNIGTENAPEWYFYDATRLAGTFADGTRNGCLRTAEELSSYRPSKEGMYGFYAYSKAGLPTPSKVPLTH